MLNLCELNGYLYQHLDREAKKKEMVRNYGSYLMHSENNSAKPDIAEQANSWLAHFAEMINDEKSELNKSAESAKAVAEVMIPECSKILRKVNAQKVGKELAKKLVDARKSLEDIYQAAIAHSAMEKQEHIEHGEKWRKHKYIDIRNGRYIYPDDLNKELAKKGRTTIQKKLNNLNNAKETADRVAKLTGNTDAAKANANNMYGVTDAKKDLAQTIKAENLMRNVTKAEKENKAANKEATRKATLDDVMKSEPMQAYAKKLAEYADKGIIKWNGDDKSADFDFRDGIDDKSPEYQELLELANKAEDYAKAAGEKSNGATDWFDIRKEMEENLLRPEIEKHRSVKHSAFEISGEEMEAFLAKRGKSITT